MQRREAVKKITLALGVTIGLPTVFQIFSACNNCETN